MLPRILATTLLCALTTPLNPLAPAVFANAQQVPSSSRSRSLQRGSCVGDKLGPGDTLGPNEYLCTSSYFSYDVAARVTVQRPKYRFGLNFIGILNLYRSTLTSPSEQVVWTAGVRGTYLVYQPDDAHLVLYGDGGQVKWSTGCYGHGRAGMVVLNPMGFMTDDAAGGGVDCALAVLDEDGSEVWLLDGDGTNSRCYPHGFPTSLPTVSPTDQRTDSPTARPTKLPTAIPTMSPTARPTAIPTLSPTLKPTSTPTVPPAKESVTATGTGTGAAASALVESTEPGVVTFYVMGDAPYNEREMDYWVPNQVASIPKKWVDFVFHAGNMMLPVVSECAMPWNDRLVDVLTASPAPVFITPGDNDWAQCYNHFDGHEAALQNWKEAFVRFDSRHWEHTLPVTYQSGREENFAFLWRRTLFLSVHLINRPKVDADEWKVRHAANLRFVTQNLIDHSGMYKVVIIMSHANPTFDHEDFFEPLTRYIGSLKEIPFVYIHGSGRDRVWDEEENFYGLPNFLRVMIKGRKDTPIKVTVDTTSDSPVWIDRRQKKKAIVSDCCYWGWPRPA